MSRGRFETRRISLIAVIVSSVFIVVFVTSSTANDYNYDGFPLISPETKSEFLQDETNEDEPALFRRHYPAIRTARSVVTPAPPQPTFVHTANTTKVQATEGSDVWLKCRIMDLGSFVVSWIRKKDLHVLSMDDKIFSSDSRLAVSRSKWVPGGDEDGEPSKWRTSAAIPPGKEIIEWVLKIGQVDPTDTGIYECQLNTEPKLSSTVSLTVVANEAKILGPKDIYIQEGSTLNLTCVVPRSRSRARSRAWSVQWERGEAKLPATSARTAVTTIIEDYEAISNLMVFNTRASDSGKYRCFAATTKPGIVNINIIKGENSAAAMQGDSAPSAKLGGCSSGLLLAACIMSILCVIPVCSCRRDEEGDHPVDERRTRKRASSPLPEI